VITRYFNKTFGTVYLKHSFSVRYILGKSVMKFRKGIKDSTHFLTSHLQNIFIVLISWNT